ncbi:MAG: hypothetical protein U0441_09985 [Polyangiaceae bacterium]
MTERRDAIENTLSLHRACPEGVVWARQFATWDDAYRALPASDWLLWACATFGYANEHKLRAFAATCAARSQSSWPDAQAARAIAVARKVSQGAATSDDLAAELVATKRAAAKIVTHADYSESMAAAACAVIGALHERAMDAAMTAARESARAIAWDPSQPASWKEESSFQVAELRALIGDEASAYIDQIRTNNRRALRVF